MLYTGIALQGFVWAGRSLQFHQQEQFRRSSAPAIGRQIWRPTDGWFRRRKENLTL